MNTHIYALSITGRRVYDTLKDTGPVKSNLFGEKLVIRWLETSVTVVSIASFSS